MNSTTQSRQRKLWARAGLLMIAGVFCVCSNVAFAMQTVGEMDASTRPKDVPLDYVVTPNGFFSPSCVQALKGGETLHAENRTIKAADGAVRKIPVCTEPHYRLNGARVESDGRSSTSPKPAAVPGIGPGWVESAEYDSPVNIGLLDSVWTVPAAPVYQASRNIIFFFPGLQQAPTISSILQPVLDFDSFNIGHWSISSWNCCVGGTTVHSDAIQVNVGDVIEGAIGCTNGNCGTGTYFVSTTNTTTGEKTVLNSTNPYGDLRQVFGGALELAGTITNCIQLPLTPITVFSTILFDTNYTQVASPTWTANIYPDASATPQCNYSVTSTSAGGLLPPSIITLTY